MAWFFLGLVFFALQAPLFVFEQNHFAKTEPFYLAPIPSIMGHLVLRADAYGKGAYGASRSHGRTHQGVDLTAPVGEKILASKSGRVVSAFEEKGYGRWIEIAHPDGLRTRYAHLSFMAVQKGDWVLAGQMIGNCGKSGNAANPHITPHLHFEIRSGKISLNPSSPGLLDPSLSLS